MANDDWLEFGGVELANLSRTAQLAVALGVDTVWTDPDKVQWIEDALGGVGYDDVTDAPWYDPTYPPSAEFIGMTILRAPGLDDSTRTATANEYIGDGGTLSAARNANLPLVFSATLDGTTDRGVEYGKRWIDRVLRGPRDRTFCAGTDLTYFRTPDVDSPKAHRRNVGLTRGASVTRKRKTDCSATWWITFTLTAVDSYEYSEEVPIVSGLGGLTPSGPNMISSGSIVLMEEPCPQFDYTPVFDPLYPALIAPPTAPTFYPEGWNLVEGMTFDRFWARVTPLSPRDLNAVPIITLTTSEDARMVRVSIFPSDSDVYDQCDPLFQVIVTYLPAGYQFVIDGEQKASYVWDGVSPLVRRTDSLVYGPDASPVDWSTVSDVSNLIVTMDIFSDSDGLEGGGQVRAALSLVSKSD